MFIPPTRAEIVILFIILSAFLAYAISTYFVPKRFQLLIGFYILLFLGLNYLVGFEIVNTVLLTSFIMGVAFLLK
jgi:hypothetical protein